MPTNLTITGSFPGVIYKATEAGGLYFEDREVTDGTPPDSALFRAENAGLSATGTIHWLRQAGAGTFGFAKAQDQSGSAVYLTPEDSASWSWTNTAPPPGLLVDGYHGVFDVRDFGAVGDGVTDDAAAINNAAIAASEAQNPGGGIVYCPTGTYLIKQRITLFSNTTLLGANRGATIIKASDKINSDDAGDPTSVIMVANEHHDGSHIRARDHFITVRDITFDGNASGNIDTGLMEAGASLDFSGADHVTIENCVVKNCFNHGISVDLEPNPFSPAPVPGYVRILNNVVDIMPVRELDPSGKNELYSGNISIRLYALDDVIISGNRIGFGNSTWANDAIDPPGCTNVIIVNNQITWSTDGIGTESDSDYVVAGNLITNCIGYAIRSFKDARPQGSEATNRMTICNNIIVGVPVDIIDPTLHGTKVGIHVDEGIEPYSMNCTIAYNVLFGPFDAVAINVEALQGSCVGNVIDMQDADGTNAVVVNQSNWAVVGNTLRNGPNGINISTPPMQTGVANVLVAHNNLAGFTSPLSGTSSLQQYSKVQDNLTINPQEASISSPSVSTAVTSNTSPFDCMVYIHGGSGVTIAVDGMTIPATSPTAVRVPSGGSIQLGYTAAPTWVWIPE
jgi:Pectate lyase superfamily protein